MLEPAAFHQPQVDGGKPHGGNQRFYGVLGVGVVAAHKHDPLARWLPGFGRQPGGKREDERAGKQAENSGIGFGWKPASAFRGEVTGCFGWPKALGIVRRYKWLGAREIRRFQVLP